MAKEISRKYHDTTEEMNFSELPDDVTLDNSALHHNYPNMHMIKLLNPQNQGTDHKELMANMAVFHCKAADHFACECPGGRLNKKDGLTRYGDSHVKDKTS